MKRKTSHHPQRRRIGDRVTSAASPPVGHAPANGASMRSLRLAEQLTHRHILPVTIRHGLPL